jgi:hypothetical protein
VATNPSRRDGITARSRAREMVNEAFSALTYGEDHTPEVPEEWSITDLIAATSAVRQLKQAAQVVQKTIDHQIASAIGLGGGARYGDTVYQFTRTSTERAIDGDAFMDYLEDNPSVMRAAVNPNYVKKGSLPTAVRETFFQRQQEPPALSARSVNDPNLPKKWAALEDGQIVYGDDYHEGGSKRD